MKHKLIGLLSVVIGATGVYFSAFITYRSFAPRAAEALLASVRINPESIASPLGGPNINLSALAYDSAGSPIWSGVSYQWGISTTNTIGFLYPNTDDKLATFEPSKTTSGAGDILVQAFGPGGSTANHSIPVSVGVIPTPTPTSAPADFIQVVYPNGGEVMERNSPYTIRWSMNGVLNTDIQLTTDTGAVIHNIATINSPTTSYVWYAFSGYPDSQQLKIKLIGNRQYGMQPIADSSDGTFIIQTPPTPTPTPTHTPTPTPSLTPSPTPISCHAADINKDGNIDYDDYTILLNNFFSTNPTNPRADINTDGIVDLTDYSILVANYNTSTGACQ